ncbi:hypothetical protein C7G42_23125 [Bradyrhizobium sp. MOS003]|nr:hypothetical protein C7G42_23125 [Bradyrhizobium sp. MOS003]
MAGLVPAIHVLPHGTKNVDARDKPGHDDLCAGVPPQTASDRSSVSTVMVPLARETHAQIFWLLSF